MESIDQAVVDPCRVSSTWVDGQGFLIDIAYVDQLSPYRDGTGVALALSTAGTGETIDDLVDANGAEFDCLVRNYSLG